MITKLALAILSLLPQNGPQPITIQNPSFEESAIAPYVWPGWTFTKSITVCCSWGGVTQWPITPDGIPPPDGTNVLYLKGETASQDLGIVAQAGTYTLTFYVAPWYYSYPGNYRVALLNGSTEWCSKSGWIEGDFTKFTVDCTTPNYFTHYPPNNGDKDYGFDPTKHMILSLSNTDGWQVVFDNVSLTFTPE